MKGKSKNVAKVRIQMHLLDKDSKIIPQNSDKSLPVNPSFVTLYISGPFKTTVVGMSFKSWQAMNLKPYTFVDGELVEQEG